jgi:hypothetical protein
MAMLGGAFGPEVCRGQKRVKKLSSINTKVGGKTGRIA